MSEDKNSQSNSTQSKYWCFTHNNPEDYDGPREWPDVQYCVWQAEVGESGTEHIQGYVAFTSRKRFSSLKKLVPEAHWEKRKRAHSAAKKYCMKDEGRISGPWEIGDDADIPDKQGTRTDLDEMKKDIDAGMALVDLASKHFSAYMRYHSGIDKFRAMTAPKRKLDVPPKIYIFWGPSGTGKSRKAANEFPGAYWKTKSDWWQGYQGETTVVFDEFYGWIKYDELLRILDWYHVEVHYKGASTPLRASTFVFTSNIPYTQWYPKVRDIHALTRRIQEFGEVHHFTGIRGEMPITTRELVAGNVSFEEEAAGFYNLHRDGDVQ